MSKKTLLEVAYAHEFDELEDRWMTLLTALPDDKETREEMTAVITWLRKVHEKDLAELFTTTLMEALEEQHPGAEAFAFAACAWEWFPEDDELRAAYARQRIKTDAENPAMPALIKLSGLEKGEERDTCVAYIDAHADLIPGNAALHIRQRFPVMIISFAPDKDTLVLSDGAREFSTNFETFRDQYHVVPTDDLRFMRVFMQAEMAEKLQATPAETTRVFLSAVGGESSFRDFKEFFVTAEFSLNDWKIWWKKNRPVIINDPWIECSDSSQPTLTLRDSPRDRSHSLQVIFDYAEHIREQVFIAFDYAEQTESKILDDIDLLRHCYDFFSDTCTDDDTVTCFFAWLGCTRLAPLINAVSLPYSAEWLATESAQKRCAQWCGWSPELILPVFNAICENEPAAAKTCAGILPYAPLPFVEECAVYLAQESPASLKTACEQIDPEDAAFAEAFAWLWSQMATGKPVPQGSEMSLCDATLLLFDLLEKLQGRSEPDGQNFYSGLCAVRRTLSLQKYAVIRDVFRICGEANAQVFFKRIHANSGISPAMKAQIVPLLSAAVEK